MGPVPGPAGNPGAICVFALLVEGANVHFLKQLPHILAQTDRLCVITFLDIVRARTDVLGLFAGFYHRLSGSCQWFPVGPCCPDSWDTAGIPLVLLLYLFAAHCWLQHNRVRIRLISEDG